MNKRHYEHTLPNIRGSLSNTYRGLHINASEDLSYHIVPQQDSFGLGRFAVCATKDGKSSQLGTDCARLFLRRFLAFLKGERSGKEIIDEICNNR